MINHNIYDTIVQPIHSPLWITTTPRLGARPSWAAAARLGRSPSLQGVGASAWGNNETRNGVIFSIKNRDFPIEKDDFPTQKGDVPMKNEWISVEIYDPIQKNDGGIIASRNDDGPLGLSCEK